MFLDCLYSLLGIFYNGYATCANGAGEGVVLLLLSRRAAFFWYDMVCFYRGRLSVSLLIRLLSFVNCFLSLI